MKVKVESAEYLQLTFVGTVVVHDCFNGIGILPTGTFGIAQRDGGIEVVQDGKTLWSSVHGVPEKE